MNKFYMNGKLIHKASDHNTKRCEVEKWVFLPHSNFERLKANPYQEHEAITAARDLMYEEKNAYHCIMLLDEYGEDGLLIEAEGFDYPRLSMFVPDAKSIYERYQTSETELKLHDMIKDTVEKISELAHTGKTDFTSADILIESEGSTYTRYAQYIPQAKYIYEQFLDSHLNEIHLCCPIEIYQHIKDHPKDNCILDKEWTLDDVENYVEEIYITGLFEPYDEYKMS